MNDELRAAILRDISSSARVGRVEPEGFFQRCEDIIMETDDIDVALTVQGLANRAGIELHNTLAKSIIRLERIEHG